MKPIEEGGGGLKQTPETFGAINLGNLDADPSTATSNIGDVYYNTTNNTIKALFTDSLGGLSWNNVAYGINIDKTQVVGTAVTLADSGTITSAMIGNTQVTLSKLSTGSVNNSKIATNADIDPTKIAGTAAILGANTFTDQQTITPATSVTALVVNAASSAVGLIVKLGASGSANLQEWQNNGGTALAWVGSGGSIVSNNGSVSGVQGVRAGTSVNLATLTVIPTAVGTVGSIIRGLASQTADLQQWQSSGTTVLGKVDSAGAFTISPSSGTALTINAAATTSVTLIVKAIASQTADLAQYQSSDATVRGGRNALAQIYSGSTAPVTVATGGAISGTSSGTTATLTSASAHGLAVGDLVTIASMTPSGYNGTYLVATVPTTTTFTVTTSGSNLGNSTVSGTASVPAQASITARSAGTVGLVVRAAASQTAVLTSWRDANSSPIASVSAGGTMRGLVVSTNNDYARLLEETSTSAGGLLQLSKIGGAAANPGANTAKIYLRDGTNAGTLKLVVRAGTAGAETTILDNIPT